MSVTEVILEDFSTRLTHYHRKSSSAFQEFLTGTTVLKYIVCATQNTYTL